MFHINLFCFPISPFNPFHLLVDVRLLQGCGSFNTSGPAVWKVECGLKPAVGARGGLKGFCRRLIGVGTEVCLSLFVVVVRG